MTLAFNKQLVSSADLFCQMSQQSFFQSAMYSSLQSLVFVTQTETLIPSLIAVIAVLVVVTRYTPCSDWGHYSQYRCHFILGTQGFVIIGHKVGFAQLRAVKVDAIIEWFSFLCLHSLVWLLFQFLCLIFCFVVFATITAIATSTTIDIRVASIAKQHPFIHPHSTPHHNPPIPTDSSITATIASAFAFTIVVTIIPVSSLLHPHTVTHLHHPTTQSLVHHQ